MPSNDSAEPELRDAEQIVILDGKNDQNSLCRELRIKLNLPTHIFVLQPNGTFKHNPLFKGADRSGPETRALEMTHIAGLHKANGVGAVVLQPSLGTDPRELLECIPLIKAIDPKIKIIAVGEFKAFFTMANTPPNERRTLIQLAKGTKVIYKDNQNIKLTDGIDALLTGIPDTNDIADVIQRIVPTLKVQRQPAR